MEYFFLPKGPGCIDSEMYSFIHTYRQASWKYQTVHTLQSGDARQVYILNRYKQTMTMTCLSARTMVKNIFICSCGPRELHKKANNQITLCVFVNSETLSDKQSSVDNRIYSRAKWWQERSCCSTWFTFFIPTKNQQIKQMLLLTWGACDPPHGEAKWRCLLLQISKGSRSPVFPPSSVSRFLLNVFLRKYP